MAHNNNTLEKHCILREHNFTGEPSVSLLDFYIWVSAELPALASWWSCVCVYGTEQGSQQMRQKAALTTILPARWRSPPPHYTGPGRRIIPAAIFVSVYSSTALCLTRRELQVIQHLYTKYIHKVQH